MPGLAALRAAVGGPAPAAPAARPAAAATPAPSHSPRPAAGPSIIAHRGYKDRSLPGNTMDSFRHGARVGAETLELDVRRLGDGTLVVHHDEKLGSRPLARLDRNRLPGGDDPHRPPTLDEVVDFARANNLRLNVELKEAGYEGEVLRSVLSKLPAERTMFMSFNEDAVRAIKQLRPDTTVGFLMYELPITRKLQQTFLPNFPVNKAREVGADFLAVHRDMATDGLISRSERAGMPLAVWTVDDHARLTRLLNDPRVDHVITNLPDLARRLKGAGH